MRMAESCQLDFSRLSREVGTFVDKIEQAAEVTEELSLYQTLKALQERVNGLHEQLRQ